MTTLYPNPYSGSLTIIPDRVVNSSIVRVTKATNSLSANRSNLNAAIVRAGNGGVVELPTGQIYQIDKGFVGSTSILPALIIGNGSTIKLPDQLFTTVASGTLSAGSTQITVADATGFTAGDMIGVTDENTTATYSRQILSVVGNVITLISGLTFYSGTSLTTGAVVTRLDSCMNFETTSELNIEVHGLMFDGNKANRTRAVHWLYSGLFGLAGTASTKRHNAWIHHCIFANGATDGFGIGDFHGLNISDCYFHDIDGSGIHYGGSGYAKNAQIIGNLFYKCYLFTDGSAGLGNGKQTATRYGHVSQRGPICWSVGPKNVIVSGNVVDTTEGYALGNGMGAENSSIVLSGNIVSSATCGAFRFDGASSTVQVTGNILNTCGHGTQYNATNEVTQISSFTGRNFSMSGNTLINSPLLIFGNNDGVKISENYFDILTLVYNGSASWFQAAIAFSSCTGKCDVDISNNYFRGPRNSTEWTALGGGAACYAVKWASGYGYGLTMRNNKIVGCSHAYMSSLSNSYVVSGFNLSDNYIIDLYSSTGQNNSAPFYLTGAGAVYKGLKISNNHCVMTSNGGGNIQANGVYIKDSPTFECSEISRNMVYSQLTSSSQKGLDVSGTCAGLSVISNAIHLGGGVNNAAISMASATSEAWVTMNRIHNGNTLSLGSATTTAGNFAS